MHYRRNSYYANADTTVSWNKMHCSLLGLRQTDGLGKSFVCFFQDWNRFAKTVLLKGCRMCSRGEGWSGITWIIRILIIYYTIHGHSRNCDTSQFTDNLLHYRMYVVIIDLSQFEKKIVLYDDAVFQTSAHEKKRKKNSCLNLKKPKSARLIVSKHTGLNFYGFNICHHKMFAREVPL